MERFVEVAEGVSLWVESRGPEDAPAVLLIMGSTVSGRVWPDELVERLARKHRVIRYDHRDTGASTWAFDRVAYSAARMAEDALVILDALGIARAHVVGLSLGGFLVQWLLVAHPERLLSATVIGAPALEGAPARANATARAPIDPDLYAFWSHMFEPRDREAQIEWRVENWRRLNGRKIPFDAEEFRALERRLIAHAGRHDTSDAHARADSSGLARGAELVHVTVPTLVITTPEDPTNPESNSRFLAETLPRSTLVTIDGMGHTISRAVVPPLAAALLNHLETVEGLAG
ncbi:10-carbomethoxy-13-deoxycarminomycin esterase [Cystobacter fuscus DSM 2262]|uniref:10-carbomethoxy-13-deoxycarminomycin esterase n=1 Tax=Cystobacter fuscus (strain ATCC 25194 / DSM 2262 / NBRC 100088 / M29) TaxID=1242864 RepID=S9P532_CYSF2|nr:alpha/beta hydrolase [Cystobacter fuscus]EPX57322.1 10-carbomethoxy-13-deoxycarminomycin esterase [Cystobacter fuscus DSM 2262]